MLNSVPDQLTANLTLFSLKLRASTSGKPFNFCCSASDHTIWTEIVTWITVAPAWGSPALGRAPFPHAVLSTEFPPENRNTLKKACAHFSNGPREAQSECINSLLEHSRWASPRSSTPGATLLCGRGEPTSKAMISFSSLNSEGSKPYHPISQIRKLRFKEGTDAHPTLHSCLRLSWGWI